jgi:hypothetical protein
MSAEIFGGLIILPVNACLLSTLFVKLHLLLKIQCFFSKRHTQAALWKCSGTCKLARSAAAWLHFFHFPAL